MKKKDRKRMANIAAWLSFIAWDLFCIWVIMNTVTKIFCFIAGVPSQGF